MWVSGICPRPSSETIPDAFPRLGGTLLQNCSIHTVTGCIEVGATRRQTLVVEAVAAQQPVRSDELTYP